MSSFFGTIFTNGRFPKEGGIYNRSNNGPLTATTGKVLIECPVCGLHVLKPAAWVRRPGRSNFFCGRACAYEFRKIKVKTSCVICQIDFYVIPSNKERLVCCSTDCSAERKRRQLIKSPITSGILPPVLTRENGNKRAKLTTEQVKQIGISDLPTKVLSEQFGVSCSTIQALRKKYRDALAAKD